MMIRASRTTEKLYQYMYADRLKSGRHPSTRRVSRVMTDAKNVFDACEPNAIFGPDAPVTSAKSTLLVDNAERLLRGTTMT